MMLHDVGIVNLNFFRIMICPTKLVLILHFGNDRNPLIPHSLILQHYRYSPIMSTLQVRVTMNILNMINVHVWFSHH